ncbi:MAG: hypothetical protein QXZ31_03645 [Thermofilaceae archaeon]
MSQSAQRMRGVLCTGDEAEVFYSMLYFVAKILPLSEVMLLTSLVPGAREILVDPFKPNVVRLFDADNKREIVVLYDWMRRLLVVEPEDAVDRAREVVERLIRVLYNYLLVLTAYYGRAEWANMRGGVLVVATDEYVAPVLLVRGLMRAIETLFPHLAVPDPDTVRELLYVLSNELVKVELPPGAVNEEELKENALNIETVRVGVKNGSHDAFVSYSPKRYSLYVGLLLRDEPVRWLPRKLDMYVLVEGNSVVFAFINECPPHIETLKRIISNRCNIAKLAIGALEEEYVSNTTLMKNLELFRRIVEEACKQLGQQRGGSG